MGKKLTILDTYGDRDAVDVLFTFTCGGHYAVIWEPYRAHGAPICHKLGWNLWQGLHMLDMEDDDDGQAVACRLLARAVEAGNGLCGEHYAIDAYEVDGVSRRRIRTYPNPALVRGIATIVPVIVRWIVAMAMALGYLYLYLQTAGLTWVYALFPQTQRGTLMAFLYVLQLAGATAFFLLRDRDRTIWDLGLNAYIPVNCITLIGAMRANVVIRWVAAAILLACVAVRVLPGLVNGLRARSLGDRLYEWKRAMSGVYAALLACVVISALGVNLFGISGYTYISRTDGSLADAAAIEERHTLALGNLDETVWQTLTTQEKLDTLQDVCDYVCAVELGCAPAVVQAGFFDGGNTLGGYSRSANTITMSQTLLDDAHVSDVLETLLHEARHVWQHTVVEMYDDIEASLDPAYRDLPYFRQASAFRFNFDTYQDGTSDDFDDYYTQEIEEDSRTWAALMVHHTYAYHIYGADDFDDAYPWSEAS